MDRFEYEMRMELQFCRAILDFIEKRHNQSLRGQRIIPRCHKHLEILQDHQLELRNKLTDEI